MAGRREIEQRLHALGDIDTILGVMKNLALMEAGKLSRILGAQREMVTSLEATAAGFLTWYPQPGPAAEEVFEVLLLIGSQRGFCGDFNDLIVAALPVAEEEQSKHLRIAVGAKLTGRVQAGLHLDGPHATEEIGKVIHAVMNTLGALLVRDAGRHPLKLAALHHDPDSGRVIVGYLAPFNVQKERTEMSPTFPPHLTIQPAAFFAQLAEQHLLAAIAEVFHRSLMAESRFRLNHIEGASRRLERRSRELKRKQALARQEEIIEEIEAILAGAGIDDLEEVNLTPK